MSLKIEENRREKKAGEREREREERRREKREEEAGDGGALSYLKSWKGSGREEERGGRAGERE